MKGVCFFIALCIIAVVSCAIVDSRPVSQKTTLNPPAGDCGACHGSEQVLPDQHISTDAMVNISQCLECHQKDKIRVKDKMPTSHAHMLNGISCADCHGSSEPSDLVASSTCIECHQLDSLEAAPPKGDNQPNPHVDYHGLGVECNSCHRQHSKSEFTCAQCHQFANVTPSPMYELTFSAR